MTELARQVALVGSAFYALLVAIERAATFWHPSFRAR
jgi:hypothetical protein